MFKPSAFISLLLYSSSLLAQSDAKLSPELEALTNRIEKLEESSQAKQKDIWDKISAVSGILSGIAVALIGFYAANIYNRRQKQHEEQLKDRQISISQADTLIKFLPNLISEDPRLRESSLLIISTLLGDDFATELAGKLGGEGAAAALVQIASSSPQKPSDSVEHALGKVFNMLAPAVVRIVNSNGSMVANGFLYGDEGLIVTPAHVANMLQEDFSLFTSSGIALKGKVVYSNEDLDLAFIVTPKAFGIAGVSLEATVPQIGMKVISLWHSPKTGLRGEVGNVILVQFQSTFTKRDEIGVTRMGSAGISGAPVIDTSGKLIGVIHASTPENVTLLIPASSIEEGLADYRKRK